MGQGKQQHDEANEGVAAKDRAAFEMVDKHPTREGNTPAPFGHFDRAAEAQRAKNGAAWQPMGFDRAAKTKSPSMGKVTQSRAASGVTGRAILQQKEEALQARAAGPKGSSRFRSAARQGASGTATRLPHMNTIQRAFGRYDISPIRAFNDNKALQANEAMGSLAYAMGDAVVLGKGTDLHTVAHEAAHVLQQRHGVHLPGGVGQVGDRYERHADAVADAVVRGQSAEPLLDAFFGVALSDTHAEGDHAQATPEQRKRDAQHGLTFSKGRLSAHQRA